MTVQSNKLVFKVGDLEYAARRPTPAEEQEAAVVYHRTWRRSAESGDYILRQRLFDVLRKQGMWDDEKQKDLDAIDARLAASEKRLNGGGIKLTEAKKLALEMAADRSKREQLMLTYVNYDEHTVEDQAQNAQFDLLCSKCIVDNEKGAPVFKSVEDYQARKAEEVALEGTKQLMKLLYPETNDWRKKLPENRFLLKFKFVDERLRLVNKEGHLVDADGRLVDEKGRFVKYVDGAQVYCDRDGNTVNEDGEAVVDARPFLDDDGNPVEAEETPAAV